MKKIAFILILLGSYCLANVDIKRLQKSCDGGNNDDCGTLGMVYLDTNSEFTDFAKAKTLLERTCKGEVVSGCVGLGIMHYSGLGVEKDSKKAFDLFKISCENKEYLGCISLGSIYYYGSGVEKDVSKAIEYFSLACENDSMMGCVGLANVFENEAEYKKAREVHKKVCDKGEKESCNAYEQLGKMGH